MYAYIRSLLTLKPSGFTINKLLSSTNPDFCLLDESYPKIDLYLSNLFNTTQDKLTRFVFSIDQQVSIDTNSSIDFIN